MMQGMVVVMRGEHVLMKIVCGCDGGHAPELAQAIRQHGLPSIKDADKLAEAAEFGCSDCRVIVTESEMYMGSHGPMEDEESMPGGEFRLYRETFQQSKFNPRWARGDGAITAFVRLR
jgi:hypothetical protein